MKKTEKTAATATNSAKKATAEKVSVEESVKQAIIEYAGLVDNKKRADELADIIKDYAKKHDEVFVENTWTLNDKGLKVVKSIRSTYVIDQTLLTGDHIEALKHSQSPECFTLKVDPKKVIFGDNIATAVLTDLACQQVNSTTYSLVKK